MRVTLDELAVPSRLVIIPVESSSTGGWHEVRRLPDGTVQCPCRGWGYRRCCRHSVQVSGWVKGKGLESLWC